jgi:hypothetical protein
VVLCYYDDIEVWHAITQIDKVSKYEKILNVSMPWFEERGL